MNTQSTILWLIPKWTLPATDGARVATDRLIRNMVKCGAIVDVLCLGNPEDKVDINQMKDEWKIRDVIYFQREIPSTKIAKIIFYIKSILSQPFCPITMSSFKSKKIKEFLKETLKEKSYDYLFLDGLHLGAPFVSINEFIKPIQVKKVIYRAHNIEVDIWIKAAFDTKNLIKKILLLWQAKLVEKYEKIIISGVDLVAPISKEDNDRINKDFSAKKSVVTLMGMNFNNPIPFKESSKNHFLFLGRLDWPPNKDGLKWFLENVWPKVDHSQNHLHIAGSGNRSWLENFKKMHGITFHGFVDNIDDLYFECDATIIPIFYGSGTRIKVVESFAKGRSIISTQMGAQGAALIPNVDYINVESAEEWLKAFSSFSKDKFKELAKSGNEKLSKQFDEIEVAKNLYLNLP